MPPNRRQVSVMLDGKMHTNLILISFAQRQGLGDKKASMSEIINKALREYFENHKDEIDAALDEYKKRGVWIE